MPKVGHGLKRWREVLQGVASECCQGQLFDRAEATGSVAVKLDGVRLERSRSFGVVWLGWILWRALKLDEQCEALLAIQARDGGVGGGDCDIGDWAAVRAFERVARGRAVVSQHGAARSARGSS